MQTLEGLLSLAIVAVFAVTCFAAFCFALIVVGKAFVFLTRAVVGL